MASSRQAALQNLATGQAATGDDDRTVGGDETVSEALSKEVFSQYKASSQAIDRGIPHPGEAAVEATSLSAIQLPDTSYPLWDALPPEVVDQGKLSQLQLEGVMYACTKHQEFLPNGERAGMFIGDGAGIGKGRQIAGVILDNFARGRRRAVWLSTSSDLHCDALRDLRALGAHINVINNCQALDRETRVVGLAKEMREGVLFMTYSTLVSHVKGSSRLDQVVSWVGPDFDGPLIFDECHKSKNFVPGKEAQSTRVATLTQELQAKLPRARVLYCSATGVSEVGNLAYMSRLGLWGPGTAFPDFGAFLDSMKARGVSFLELLAMEMKAEGFYLARSLSFRDAEFTELECRLTEEQVQMYDGAVHQWQALRAGLAEALEVTGTTSRDLWKPFWGTHQRFFKLLCISLKIPTVVAEARKALEAGQAVVIGLQSTGEAAADALKLEPGQVCGFVSTTREMLSRFVMTHLPVQYDAGPNSKAQPELAGKQNPQCLQLRDDLLASIQAAQLPPNFLDELVDALGGAQNVAEMTGRRARVVRNKKGHGTYELRAKPDSTEMDSLNVNETAAFMRGEKLVAIVSDAASTGISLHASKDVKNQRRRVHVTIELPWSADKAIQQLGRSHRSNQVSGPLYKLMVTNLGGEKRFAAAVARRLQSLGALTRGDRRAAAGVDLSESNLDNPLGRKSLRRMYDCIIGESPVLPANVSLATVLEGCSSEATGDVLDVLPTSGQLSAAALAPAVVKLHQVLRDSVGMMAIGVEVPRSDTVAEQGDAGPSAVPGGTGGKAAAKDLGDVRRFLNRLLGVTVARQGLLFSYFAATLTAEIQAAKAEGRYFEGLSDLSGSAIERTHPKPEVLWTDPSSSQRTLRHDLTIDRGMTYEAAVRRLAHERTPGDASGFRKSRRPMFGRDIVLLATQKPGTGGLFDIIRPNTGASLFDMPAEELTSKYVRMKEEDVKDLWNGLYEASAQCCMHGANCAQGMDCQVGKRKTQVTILGGSVVRVWGALEGVLQRHEHSLSRSDRTMRAVHVSFPDGSLPLIGVRYPARLLPEVVEQLQAAQILARTGKGAAPGQASNAEQAAALGAAMHKAVEPPTPVHQPSLTKAFRAPLTVKDFFKARTASPAAEQLPQQPTAKRKLGATKPKPGKRQATFPAASKGSQINLTGPAGNPGAKAKREENGIKGQDSGGFSFPAGPGQDDAEEAPSTAPQPAWQPSANPAQSADEVKATPDAAQEEDSETEAVELSLRPDSSAPVAVPPKLENGEHSQPAERSRDNAGGKIGKLWGLKGFNPPLGLIHSVTSMGFTRQQAVEGLRHSQGNIQQAVDWIIAKGG